jgi:hypothetical protein
MIFRFMVEQSAWWSIDGMARVLNVSASEHYAGIGESLSLWQSPTALVEEINRIYKRPKLRYNSPRVWMELKASGV